MSRLMMGFHIILVLMFFTGREMEASPLNRCLEMTRFSEDIDSFMKLENREILNLFCKNATRSFKCVSDVLKEHTGFTLKEMANVMEGTDGEYLNSLVEIEQSVEEICMNVTQIQSGIEIEASPLNRCYGMMTFNKDLDSFMTLEHTEVRTLFCTNITRYFDCISDVLKEHLGFTITEMANHRLMKGTESGEYLNSLVKMNETVGEMCRNGTQIQSGLDMDFPCFERGRMIPVKHCKGQSVLGYLAFTDQQSERELSEADNECIIMAYQHGCIAATLREECSLEAFNRYKTVIKKAAIFRDGTCSRDLKETLKTTFLGLDMKKSQKKIYHAILDLK